jgi:hypothetical protein
MLVGSIIIIVVLVALVVGLFSLFNLLARSRQDVRSRSDEMQVMAGEEQSFQLALQAFRHDLGNLLGMLQAERAQAEATVARGDLDEARLALARLEGVVQESIAFSAAFQPGGPEEQPLKVPVTVLVERLARQYRGPEQQAVLEPGLAGWYEVAPLVTLAMLIGNLLKNAFEAADTVTIRREGHTLSIENPVSEADEAWLRRADPYCTVRSSKGDGRGIGLASVRVAANRCGAEVSHRLLEGPEGLRVRFRLTFGART